MKFVFATVVLYIAKTYPQNPNDNTIPPPAGERRARRQPDWICAFAATSAGAGKYGYANEPAIETADWTNATYQTDSDDAVATLRGVVGKNVNGEGIFILTQRTGEGTPNSFFQLAISDTDATVASDWTNFKVFNNSSIYRNMFTALKWAESSDGAQAGVWIGGTGGGKMVRSTNGGESWTEITDNMPADWNPVNTGGQDDHVPEIASDGKGTWAVIQEKELFVSTNDGLNWTEVAHGISNVGVLRSIIYTNNSFVIVYKLQGENDMHIVSAAATDLTDWAPL